MKRTVYIETTVVSYLTAMPSSDPLIAGHQKSTRDLWPLLLADYETYVSDLVLQEAGRGNPEQARERLNALEPFHALDATEEARALAARIIADGGIPLEYPEDAGHVAIAALNGIEVVLTWNFAHLNNPFTRMKIRKIVEHAGYACPEICSPDELLEADR
jgi:predicted nucleic acid-binding protein